MNASTRRLCAGLLALSLSLPLLGCGADTQYMTPERMENGLVVVLPGIEGRSVANENIRDGILATGTDRAITIYSWGRPVPGVGMLLNQMDAVGNRVAGRNLAQYIGNYLSEYPGRPVHIVGHSGGGGVAVFAAEEMPTGRQVNGLVLLSASISANYDLSRALGNCSAGIVNFYNPDDTALLGVGTAIAGNVDGGHGASAGQAGFTRNYPRLYSRAVSGYGDPHFAATRVGFVRREVAPWALSRTYPPR